MTAPVALSDADAKLLAELDPVGECKPINSHERLCEAGLIIWRGGWRITELGEDALERDSRASRASQKESGNDAARLASD